MTTRRNPRSFAVALALLLTGGTAALLLRGQPTQAQTQSAEKPDATPITKWEYTIVRLEGPEPRHRDASLAVLRRYGAEGWEAAELLPPAYDILMKRPITAPAGR